MFQDLSKLSPPCVNITFQNILDEICHKFELEHVYCVFITSSSSYLISSLDDKMRKTFLKDAHEANFPITEEARKMITPLDWSRLQNKESFQNYTKTSNVFKTAINGMTFPVQCPDKAGFAALNITSSRAESCWHKFVALNTPHFCLISHKLVELLKIVHEDSNTFDCSPVQLSNKELEALETIKSCSNTGFSTSHNIHLRTARYKLNALTNNHAVARAICMGVLDPSPLHTRA